MIEFMTAIAAILVAATLLEAAGELAVEFIIGR